MLHNDLTFFTNEPERDLYTRFNNILINNTNLFDVLVGYFRTSGFHMLYPAMKDIDKIRILVGLNVDNKTMKILQQAEGINLTEKEAKEGYISALIEEMEQSDDNYSIEIGVHTFVSWLLSGKIEMRIYTEASLHAKVYIMRKDMEKDTENYGSVITGSSNFSSSGLKNNLEFNVELKDSRDVDFALGIFEELWAKSIDIQEEYTETITNRTWHKKDITPYEMFVKTLYEYFSEELNEDKADISSEFLPNNFMKLQYQADAVVQAKKIIDAYGGVFISDVVGLGKTYICALLAQKLRGHKLIICPPILMKMWNETIDEFDLDATVMSLGVLEDIRNNDALLKRTKHIFIDEAHRFRNQTETFAKLHEICYMKNVILISATPQNNYTTDIANQIYLFQDKNNSNIIPNEKNLELFFSKLMKKQKSVERYTPKYMEIQKENSAIIRDKVLRNILIRRTRSEIVKYYKKDLEEQGLKFPVFGSPQQIVYEYTDDVEEIFNSTIKAIANMNYSRYKPLTYLINQKPYATMIVSQQNMGGFMKSILIKRLESSFEAFKKTLNRFIQSYEKFINMCNDGVIFISKKVNVYDMLEDGEIEKLLELVENEDVIRAEITDFRDDFIIDLQKDLRLLKGLFAEWETVISDPKKEQFIKELKTNKNLKDKQMIIFTESKETAIYIEEYLKNEFGTGILMYSGQGSKHIRNRIEANYDPKYRGEKQEDIKILVTTDVLAEGINLHRASVIVNYDLPWNPTKVMQRVGRINRVGTEHNEIFVFNFFPTAQANKHLPLEQNIINKIQAFHDTLGEDFKYLSDTEEVSSHNLYKMLNENAQDEEETSLLEYLNIIREIRDTNENLFEKIKKLPKKAKVARTKKNGKDSTISFVKKGGLKRFLMSDGTASSEMTDLDALRVLKADEKEKAIDLPRKYFEHLKLNKAFFDWMLKKDDIVTLESTARNTNDAKISTFLKALKNVKTFTDIEDITIKELIKIFEKGSIPANIAKEIVRDLKNQDEPHKIYAIIRNGVPEKYFEDRNGNKKIDISGNVEIVLSEYLKGANK